VSEYKFLYTIADERSNFTDELAERRQVKEFKNRSKMQQAKYM
jgi:hypothetical protein